MSPKGLVVSDQTQQSFIRLENRAPSKGGFCSFSLILRKDGSRDALPTFCMSHLFQESMDELNKWNFKPVLEETTFGVSFWYSETGELWAGLGLVECETCAIEDAVSPVIPKISGEASYPDGFTEKQFCDVVFYVGNDGKPQGSTILNCPDPYYQSVQSAIDNWVFEPMKISNIAVFSIYKAQISFKD